ncbi:unnamed protein product [Calicophoron daubneyi]|uniref:Uncharacterized protein n=1 Tax=Calicophoron daubneyi TaxID=300641 RepID=A0AAV2T495_CALDB
MFSGPEIQLLARSKGFVEQREHMQTRLDDLSAQLRSRDATDNTFLMELTQARAILSTTKDNYGLIHRRVLQTRSKLHQLATSSEFPKELNNLVNNLGNLREKIRQRHYAAELIITASERNVKTSEKRLEGLLRANADLQECHNQTITKHSSEREKWIEQNAQLAAELKIFRIKYDEERARADRLNEESSNAVRKHIQEVEELQHKLQKAQSEKQTLKENLRRLEGEVASLQDQYQCSSKRHRMEEDKNLEDIRVLKSSINDLQTQLEQNQMQTERLNVKKTKLAESFKIQEEELRLGYSERHKQQEDEWSQKCNTLAVRCQQMVSKTEELARQCEEAQMSTNRAKAEATDTKNRLRDAEETIVRLTAQASAKQYSQQINNLKIELEKHQRKSVVLKEEHSRVMATMREELEGNKRSLDKIIRENQLLHASVAEQTQEDLYNDISFLVDQISTRVVLTEKQDRIRSITNGLDVWCLFIWKNIRDRYGRRTDFAPKKPSEGTIEQLKSTVRKECEERDELNEALNKTRAELLRITENPPSGINAGRQSQTYVCKRANRGETVVKCSSDNLPPLHTNRKDLARAGSAQDRTSTASTKSALNVNAKYRATLDPLGLSTTRRRVLAILSAAKPKTNGTQ